MRRLGGLTLPLSYAFEPGTADDGVTVDVPLGALDEVAPTTFTWQVPGLREELVTALIRSLPKQLRRRSCRSRTWPPRCFPGLGRAASRCSTRWAASWLGEA